MEQGSMSLTPIVQTHYPVFCCVVLDVLEGCLQKRIFSSFCTRASNAKSGLQEINCPLSLQLRKKGKAVSSAIFPLSWKHQLLAKIYRGD